MTPRNRSDSVQTLFLSSIPEPNDKLTSTPSMHPSSPLAILIAPSTTCPTSRAESETWKILRPNLNMFKAKRCFQKSKCTFRTNRLYTMTLLGPKRTPFQASADVERPWTQRCNCTANSIPTKTYNNTFVQRPFNFLKWLATVVAQTKDFLKTFIKTYLTKRR